MAAKRKDYAKAVEMYESGLSIADVAFLYGISRQAMRKILERRGVSFRSNLKYQQGNHFYRHGIPQDKRVVTIVRKAIKSGCLIAKPCERCGASGKDRDGRNLVDAHHDDYNKPLDIRWLCGPCHREWHQSNEPTRRTAHLAAMPRSEIGSMGGKATWTKNREKALSQLAEARRGRGRKT
jgi:transposase-like protein